MLNFYPITAGPGGDYGYTLCSEHAGGLTITQPPRATYCDYCKRIADNFGKRSRLEVTRAGVIDSAFYVCYHGCPEELQQDELNEHLNQHERES